MLPDHLINVVHLLMVQVLVVTHLLQQLVRLEGTDHVQQGLLGCLHELPYDWL
jgi:hypothetical protein